MIKQNSRLLFCLLFLLSSIGIGVVVVFAKALLRGDVASSLEEEHGVANKLQELLPFCCLGIISCIASIRGFTIALCVWLGGLLLVSLLFVEAYWEIQAAIKKGAWTGAAIGEGLLPYAGIVAAFLGCFLGWLVGKRLYHG
jgi:hypothetical protein